MLVPVGPIALVRKDWGLRGGAITSVVAENSEGRPDVLCAQMICGAAFSGVKVLVLLAGGRDDEAWQAIGQLLGGGDRRTAADVLRELPMRMYASGTGKEHAGGAELVYAPGLRLAELERIRSSTSAAVLTLSGDEGDVAGQSQVEVIRVGGDFIALDVDGSEISVEFDESGPVYRPDLSAGPEDGESAS